MIQMTDTKFVVSIPTFNSEKTLGNALDSLAAQTYKAFNCNIVDSSSVDGTIRIAKERGIETINYEGKLLGARLEGFRNTEGVYVIFMDSDQVLEKTALERLANLIEEKDPDMIILEEHSYRPNNWVQKMYDLDHEIVHQEYDYYVSPIEGVLLPRVYRRSLLVDAFNNINKDLYPHIVTHDHAIIYYECSLLSDSIDLLNNAIFHQDLSRLRDTFRHFARYGANVRDFEKTKVYNEIVKRKIHGRTRGMIRNNLGKKMLTFPLLFTKGIGYYYGYYFGIK